MSDSTIQARRHSLRGALGLAVGTNHGTEHISIPAHVSVSPRHIRKHDAHTPLHRKLSRSLSSVSFRSKDVGEKLTHKDATNHEMTTTRYKRLVTQLSADERREISDAFRAIDLDRSGGIESDELGPLLKMLGYVAKQEELTTLLGEFDYDNSGVLSEHEFVLMVASMAFLQWPPIPERQDERSRAIARRQAEVGARAHFERGFRFFDPKHTSRIDLMHIERMVANGLADASELNDLRDMQAEAAKLGFVDADAKLDYHGFVEHMLNKTGLMEHRETQSETERATHAIAEMRPAMSEASEDAAELAPLASSPSTPATSTFRGVRDSVMINRARVGAGAEGTVAALQGVVVGPTADAP